MYYFNNNGIFATSVQTLAAKGGSSRNLYQEDNFICKRQRRHVVSRFNSSAPTQWVQRAADAAEALSNYYTINYIVAARTYIMQFFAIFGRPYNILRASKSYRKKVVGLRAKKRRELEEEEDRKLVFLARALQSIWD